MKQTDFCTLPQGVSGSPETIDQVTTLVNALPKPVSVACFLSVLERPLKVSLTNNSFSAQPAMGDRSPRIFIIKNDLYISIVPEGVGSHVVEFSQLTSDNRSIKAELDFPVTETLTPDAPYTTVRASGGTVCAGCHTQETKEESYTFADVFSSVAFRPNPSSLVNLDEFKKERAKCNKAVEPDRCHIIEAFLGFGNVETQNFPETMTFL